MKNKLPLIINSIVTALVLSLNTMAFAESKVKIKNITVNDYSIAYTEQGDGEPLVLIHGSLSDYRTWLKTLKDFSEYNRTIAVSLRHYYPEQWNGKGNDLGLEQDVKDMAAFIWKMKLGKVNLVGHSRGGAVAMLLASRHPELVKRLVLADPAPLASMLKHETKTQQFFTKRKTVLESSVQHLSNNNINDGLKVFVDHIAGKDAWKKTSKLRRKALIQNAMTLKSLANDVEISFNCEDLKKVTVPVLMVTGEYSKPIYGKMNKAVSSCLKEARNVTVADAGHMMHSANPTAFIFEIQDFVVAY